MIMYCLNAYEYCYTLIKSSPALSHVSWLKMTNISDVTSHQTLMMGTEMVPYMSDILPTLIV
jgi:hypothetical protein